MRGKKTVTLTCYGAVAKWPDAETKWEDVWLRLHDRRKVVTLAPFVGGTTTLDDEIATLKVCVEKYADTRDVHATELKQVEHIKQCLSSERIVVLAPGRCGLDDIYVAEPFLTRATIEEALTAYLTNLGYLKAGAQLRYRWRKARCVIVGA